jgi:hypothetical protein
MPLASNAKSNSHVPRDFLSDKENVELVHFDCQGQELPVLEEAFKAGEVMPKIRALHRGVCVCVCVCV